MVFRNSLHRLDGEIALWVGSRGPFFEDLLDMPNAVISVNYFKVVQQKTQMKRV